MVDKIDYKYKMKANKKLFKLMLLMLKTACSWLCQHRMQILRNLIHVIQSELTSSIIFLTPTLYMGGLHI